MAITTTLYYPPAYLPGPLEESSGLTPVPSLKRTWTITDRAWQRHTYTSTPTQIDLAWAFSNAQAQAFGAWFRDELPDEAAWFNIPLLTLVGLENYVCRFTDAYKGPMPEGGFCQRYTVPVELWECLLPPSGWEYYPEWIVGSSLLDTAPNKEWPEYDSD